MPEQPRDQTGETPTWLRANPDPTAGGTATWLQESLEREIENLKERLERDDGYAHHLDVAIAAGRDDDVKRIRRLCQDVDTAIAAAEAKLDELDAARARAQPECATGAGGA